jgi:hypothetical protein
VPESTDHKNYKGIADASPVTANTPAQGYIQIIFKPGFSIKAGSEVDATIDLVNLACDYGGNLRTASNNITSNPISNNIVPSKKSPPKGIDSKEY